MAGRAGEQDHHGVRRQPRLPCGNCATARGRERSRPRARIVSARRGDGARFAAYPWLEVGWGDEGFYRDVPTVASLNVGLALRALFRPGNPSVVQVVGVQGEPPAVFRHSDIVRLDLTEAGFVRLAAKVDATFFQPAGGKGPDALGPGLYGASLFFRAVGAFHIFNVCNHWIADLLDAAGIPTVRLLATLPAGLLLDLKWRAGNGVLPRLQP